MNLQWKRLLLTVAMPVAMAVMAPAQAIFLVDDFGALPAGQGIDPDTGVNNSYVARDTTINNNFTVVSAPPKFNGGTFQNNMMVNMPGGTDNPNGWSRNIASSLTQGDGVQTEICYNCQAAHLVADAGVASSDGDYYIEWLGSSLDLSGNADAFKFDWGADLAGTTWSVTFNGIPTIDGGSLPAAAGLSHTASLDLSGVNLNGITSIRLDFSGVGNLDANIDNVRLVPEPSILALLSVSLLGLGWVRRRRRAG